MGDKTGIWLQQEVLDLGLPLTHTAIISMAINMPQNLHASNRSIAKMLNTSIRTIIRTISDLQNKGIITIEGNTSSRVIKVNMAQVEGGSYSQYGSSATANMASTSANMAKTTANMADNIKDNKYKKGNNKGIVKTKKNQIVKKEKTIHPLYNSIKDSFLSKNNNIFTNYAKEGQAIKSLIKKAEDRNKENPEIFIQGMIEQFYKLSSNGDKFWGSQPFLPSRLNSSGIFDSVLKKVQDSQPKELQINVLEGLTW